MKLKANIHKCFVHNVNYEDKAYQSYRQLKITPNPYNAIEMGSQYLLSDIKLRETEIKWRQTMIIDNVPHVH